VSSEPKLLELSALYSTISRMRVLSAPRAVASADKLMLIIIDAYFTPARLRSSRSTLRPRHGCCQPVKEKHMARSTQNDPHRQSPAEVERALHEDRAEVVGSSAIGTPSATGDMPDDLSTGTQKPVRRPFRELRRARRVDVPSECRAAHHERCEHARRSHVSVL
jgi:hypothetical protein